MGYGRVEPRPLLAASIIVADAPPTHAIGNGRVGWIPQNDFEELIALTEVVVGDEHANRLGSLTRRERDVPASDRRKVPACVRRSVQGADIHRDRVATGRGERNREGCPPGIFPNPNIVNRKLRRIIRIGDRTHAAPICDHCA